MELGRTLWRLGDKHSALAELESAMDLDVEDINAHLQKARVFLSLSPQAQQGPAHAPVKLHLSAVRILLASVSTLHILVHAACTNLRPFHCSLFLVARREKASE